MEISAEIQNKNNCDITRTRFDDSLTPWLMTPAEPIQFLILIPIYLLSIYAYPFLEVSFLLSLPVKILKALLPSPVLAACPAYFNLLDLITLSI